MLEIIALVFLTKEIGRLAHDKGLKPQTWKFYTIAGWILFEFIGCIVGVLIFGRDNLFSVMLVGLAFAVTSYFILNAQLKKLPDFNDDIDEIGNN